MGEFGGGGGQGSFFFLASPLSCTHFLPGGKVSPEAFAGCVSSSSTGRSGGSSSAGFCAELVKKNPTPKSTSARF